MKQSNAKNKAIERKKAPMHKGGSNANDSAFTYDGRKDNGRKRQTPQQRMKGDDKFYSKLNI